MATVVTNQGHNVLTGRMIGGTPTQAEPKNVAWGTGAGTAAVTDLTLFAEDTGGSPAYARQAGTSTQQTTTIANDTYQVVGTITAGGTRAITEAALFDQTGAPAQTVTVTDNPLTAGATTMHVSSATGFPGSGNYLIQIDSEVIQVTGGQGTTTWTITRGTNGTSGASHALGAVVMEAGTTVAGGGTGGGGQMLVHGNFSVINLNTNDSITFTVKVQFS